MEQFYLENYISKLIYLKKHNDKFINKFHFNSFNASVLNKL